MHAMWLMIGVLCVLWSIAIVRDSLLASKESKRMEEDFGIKKARIECHEKAILEYRGNSESSQLESNRKLVLASFLGFACAILCFLVALVIHIFGLGVGGFNDDRIGRTLLAVSTVIVVLDLAAAAAVIKRKGYIDFILLSIIINTTLLVYFMCLWWNMPPISSW